MRQYVVVPVARGSAVLVVTARGLSRVILTGRRGRAIPSLLREMLPDAECKPDLLPALQRQLRDYFRGRRVRFRARLDLSGLTHFQRRVLDGCVRVAYGETVTYGELAGRIGRPSAARAVGHALGRNPVPIVIPCHRVIASDGSPGGYSAEQGVALKRWLLKLECPRHARVP